jgi:14-3-3 protein epsilon
MSLEKKIFMARVADQAERYDDMVNFLKEIMAESNEDVSVDVRNLLSVGFKNLIGSRRAAWRTVSAIEQNKKYEQYSARCAEYKAKIEKELSNLCEAIIKSVNDHSLKKADSPESKTFYLKMIGDYYRYIAECVKGDKLAEVTEFALQFYTKAAAAAKELPSYNSTRLGLSLNFSVFFYELKNDSKKACELAQEALDGAKADIESMDNDDARDAISIVELLKENLDLWKEAEGENDD